VQKNQGDGTASCGRFGRNRWAVGDPQCARLEALEERSPVGSVIKKRRKKMRKHKKKKLLKRARHKRKR
jgi:hypothetical protein